MQLIQEPPEELKGVPDLGDLEPLTTDVGAFLQELMWRDLPLERLGVPHFPAEHAESLNELGSVRIRRSRIEDEVISERDHVYEGVKNGVHVAVGFDVVQADETWIVRLLVQVVSGRGALVDLAEEGRREGGVE